MSEHKIKTLSNISPIGIETLSKTACVLDEESKDPDGVLVRSAKLNKSNLNNTFKILGSVNQEEMRLLFEIADLSVSLPLRAEGFGRTISESLYCGTPVIAFNYGGAKSQLEHLNDFFKSTPQDYNSLPNKIDLLLNLSEEQKIKILQNVKTVIEKNFSRENMVNQYLKFYESTQS